jgi:signal transduction histidine kinase
VKGVLGCLTDISRQKWAEGFQARRTDEAIELKRQQENFMDMTSHEARNPLSAITLCAESILTTLKELLNTDEDIIHVAKDTIETHHEGAEIIMACAQHQKRIIDDVLTLSKLDSGLLVICPIEVQPVETIKQALNMFSSELIKSDIRLQYDLLPTYLALIDWVRIDPSRLTQGPRFCCL